RRPNHWSHARVDKQANQREAENELHEALDGTQHVIFYRRAARAGSKMRRRCGVSHNACCSTGDLGGREALFWQGLARRDSSGHPAALRMTKVGDGALSSESEESEDEESEESEESLRDGCRRRTWATIPQSQRAIRESKDQIDETD